MAQEMCASEVDDGDVEIEEDQGVGADVVVDN